MVHGRVWWTVAVALAVAVVLSMFGHGSLPAGPLAAAPGDHAGHAHAAEHDACACPADPVAARDHCAKGCASLCCALLPAGVHLLPASHREPPGGTTEHNDSRPVAPPLRPPILLAA